MAVRPSALGRLLIGALTLAVGCGGDSAGTAPSADPGTSPPPVTSKLPAIALNNPVRRTLATSVDTLRFVATSRRACMSTLHIGDTVEESLAPSVDIDEFNLVAPAGAKFIACIAGLASSAAVPFPGDVFLTVIMPPDGEGNFGATGNAGADPACLTRRL